MPRKKLIKYNQFQIDNYCFSCRYKDQSLTVKESISEIFKAKSYKTIVLELCAGYCEYSLHHAVNNPNNLHIAIDLKEDRLMSGCLVAREKKLENIRFLSCDIANLNMIFREEIDLIYLIHPDPQTKNKSKRLNQINFLEIYYQLLKQDGNIQLITDHQDFYDEFLKNYPKLAFQRIESDTEILETRYHKMFVNTKNQSKTIKVQKKLQTKLI